MRYATVDLETMLETRSLADVLRCAAWVCEPDPDNMRSEGIDPECPTIPVTREEA